MSDAPRPDNPFARKPLEQADDGHTRPIPLPPPAPARPENPFAHPPAAPAPPAPAPPRAHAPASVASPAPAAPKARAASSPHTPAPAPARGRSAAVWLVPLGVLLAAAAGFLWWRQRTAGEREAAQAARLAQTVADREKAKPVPTVPATWFGNEPATAEGGAGRAPVPVAGEPGGAPAFAGTPTDGRKGVALASLGATASYSLTESADGAYRFAWKADVSNPGTETVSFDFELQFLDASGNVVDSVRDGTRFLAAGASTQLAGSKSVSLPGAESITSCKPVATIRR